jgi:hypothetical protein
MPTLLIALPVVVFLTSVPICLRALVLHDRLLANLYNNHHALWRELGSPRGWMWQPPSGGSLFPVMPSAGICRIGNILR